MAQYRCLKPAFVDNSMKEIGDVVTFPDDVKVSDTTFEIVPEPEPEPEVFKDPIPPKMSDPSPPKPHGKKPRRKPKPKDEDTDLLD